MTGGGDTIVALASGRGLAGVAVIRLSGPNALDIARSVCGDDLPEPRKAGVRRFLDEAGQVVDEGLVIIFPGPASFTGDDVVEFHGHGGRATVSAILFMLCMGGRARLAEPGEFSKRAFQAGKMDLTQAEGLADLIHAETEAQRKQALRQMGGGLLDLYSDWRSRLIAAMAHLEATIDFSDQEIPDGLLDGVDRALSALDEDIRSHLSRAGSGERLRDGLFVSIIGAPNVGKSSLLNALARRDAAIVSDIAGTTRDVVEVHMDLAGFPVVLVDTAGIRETDDAVEAEGVRRARQRAEEADVTLVLLDGGAWPDVPAEIAGVLAEADLVITNKQDQMNPNQISEAKSAGHLAISAKTSEGMARLEQELQSLVSERMDLGDAPAPTRERHRQCLERCLDAMTGAKDEPEIALQGEALRQAALELGRLTGRIDVEDLLDVVFSDFCIGK